MEEFKMVQNPKDTIGVGTINISPTDDPIKKIEELLRDTDYFDDLIKEADDVIEKSQISLEESRRERKSTESLITLYNKEDNKRTI